MHGNTFHSLWMLQLEHSDNTINDEDKEEDNSSICPSTASSSSSDTFLIATNRQPPNGVICSPYQIEETPKADESPRHIQKYSNYTLTNLHLILLLITSSINALMVKVFCVFSGFIYSYYNISFTTLTLILGISTLSTMIAVFINPYILFLRCNILIFVVQSLQIIGLMIIISFSHYVLLTIGICLLFNTYQIHWGVANTMISSFIQPQNDMKRSNIRHAAITKKRYLTIFNTQWTISTLYFFIVGVLSESSSFFGFLSFIMAIAIVLAIMNAVILPKQPALPTKLQLNNQIYNHVHIFNLIPASFSKDIQILCGNKRFLFVCFGFMLTFFIWGWFYVTFGPFLQQLYSLNTIKFGAYTAIIEAVGNGIAMISYIYFGSIFITKSTNHIKKSSTYIETEILLLISSCILFISLLCISLITHIPSLHLLLSNEIIVGIVITFYFLGHEGSVIGLMILHVEVTPVLQQPRASGIVSMINCIMVFMSQSIIIGPLDSKYYKINFKTELIILLMVSICLLIVIIILTINVYKLRNKKIIISQLQSSLPSVTTYNEESDEHTIHTPINHVLNGKSYTYHTINSMNHSGATDLVFNNYKI